MNSKRIFVLFFLLFSSFQAFAILPQTPFQFPTLICKNQLIGESASDLKLYNVVPDSSLTCTCIDNPTTSEWKNLRCSEFNDGTIVQYATKTSKTPPDCTGQIQETVYQNVPSQFCQTCGPSKPQSQYGLWGCLSNGKQIDARDTLSSNFDSSASKCVLTAEKEFKYTYVPGGICTTPLKDFYHDPTQGLITGGVSIFLLASLVGIVPNIKLK